jgi:16S rRNA (guanine1516-N2)-methyltransferase
MTLNFYIDVNSQIPDVWHNFIRSEKIELLTARPLEFFSLNKYGEFIFVSNKGEIKVDFASCYNRFLSQRGRISPGPLYRALALKNRVDVSIVDATGGTGKDSALLLSFGTKLTVFERHPILQILWRAELLRLSQTSSLAIIFHAQDVASFVFSDVPQIIYFDPMYRQDDKNTKALSRQSMEIFEDMVGADTDQEEVLKKLLISASERVVVKRAIKAAPLLTPSMSYEGKTARYDTYLIRK